MKCKARGDKGTTDEGDRLPKVLVEEVSELVFLDFWWLVMDPPATALRNGNGRKEILVNDSHSSKRRNLRKSSLLDQLMLVSIFFGNLPNQIFRLFNTTTHHAVMRTFWNKILQEKHSNDRWYCTDQEHRPPPRLPNVGTSANNAYNCSHAHTSSLANTAHKHRESSSIHSWRQFGHQTDCGSLCSTDSHSSDLRVRRQNHQKIIRRNENEAYSQIAL